MDESSLFQIVARVGEQRGIFRNGVRGFGDWVGEYGARLATLDCELEDTLMRDIYQAQRCYLEVVDCEKGIYRIPYDRAPEAYGVNIIRIVPDEDTREVAAEFTGFHNPQMYSDWRACLVAVGKDKVRRYSPMKNRGKLSLARKDCDRSYFLAVTATPTAIYNGEALGEMYNGAFSPRYPWQVQLTGARPGTTHHIRAELGDSSLLCRARNVVPEPADTPFGAQFLAELKKYRESLARHKATADKAQIAKIEELEPAVNDEIDGMTNGHRHPRGGGWVQNTATVADTAYVGPNAYVLGKAQVLDNAAIEDSAIVVDDAVVRDNAKVSGRAIISGSAVVSGYARTWVPHGGSTYTSVSKGGTPSPYGLLANYAMDCENSYQLVDYYRFGEIGCDGYRWGDPRVVTDGKRTGFRFDTKKQYLELSQRVADLRQITVASEFKSEGTGEQTLFDFGCDADNRFVFTTGKSAKPTLKAFVDGKNLFTLTSSGALQANTWTALRVEIDGSKTTLWADGKKVAELATSFRPCDVFIPGKAKRNLVATDFQGIIDNLVLYHQVNPDFERLPPPTIDAPPIPTLAFIKQLEVKTGQSNEVNAKVRAITNELAAPYKVMTQKAEARRDELMNRDAGYVAAKKMLAAAEQAVARRKAEIATEVRASADGAKLLEEIAGTKAKGLRDQTRELESALKKLTENAAATGIADVNKKVVEATIALKEAEAKASARYQPQLDRIDSFTFQINGGYYNYNHGKYYSVYAMKKLGGGEVRDNVLTVRRVYDAWRKKGDWHTRVDWDWRMKEEIDGSIHKAPQMNKWLENTRGPVK